MANSSESGPTGAAQKRGKPQAAEGREMPIRVLGPTLALLSFSVVCVGGLLRGHSFSSVVTSSLVALVVGGAAGVLLALVVRLVAVEGFHHHFKPEGLESPQAAGGAPAQESHGAAAPAGRERTAPPAVAAKK